MLVGASFNWCAGVVRRASFNWCVGASRVEGAGRV